MTHPLGTGGSVTRRRFLGLLGSSLAWPMAADLAATEADPAVDDAARRGLAYLAVGQLADGSWPDGGQGAGVVGACMLAFLAHGHLPGRSPQGYARVVERAREWLLTRQRGDGSIIGVGISPMYQHGLATLALAEALGAGPDQRLRRAVEGCVDCIVRCQNRRGGWRHMLSTEDGDESPGSVGQLMALRSAANAGIAVPPATLHAAERYVRACQSRRSIGGDGGWRYTIETVDSNWSRTGAGCCALQMAGRYDDDAVAEGLAFIERFQPMGGQPVADDGWWHYGAYYTTLACWLGRRLPGGQERWRRFYPAMLQGLIARQRPDGSWAGGYEPYETAASLLVLGFPADYLPIHQR